MTGRPGLMRILLNQSTCTLSIPARTKHGRNEDEEQKSDAMIEIAENK